MQLPPTDAQGRFVPVFRDGSILKRMFAKLVDSIVCGVTIWGFSKWMSLPWAAAIGVLWYCTADASGSPGKWFFRLRVVMMSGAPVTMFAALKRNVVLGLPTLGRAMITAGWGGLDADASKWDRGFLACVGLAVVLGEVTGMLLQPMNRRWGDTFAGTRVVER